MDKLGKWILLAGALVVVALCWCRTPKETRLTIATMVAGAVSPSGLVRPWARMRRHGPTTVFDYHSSESEATSAIADSAKKYGEQVRNFQTVAYFPLLDQDREEDTLP